MIYLQLFLSYLKIGFFGFGGGYAMLSLIQNEMVTRHGWMTATELADIVAVSQMTPGPIAINCATFVGYRECGLRGAAAATVGMVLPSFLIIFFISSFLDHFLEIGWIARAFRGIRLAVGLLILNAGIIMMRKMKEKPFQITVLAVSLVVMMMVNLFSIHLSSILLLLTAAVVSLILFSAEKKGGAAG